MNKPNYKKVGSKFDDSMDIKDIAKLIRKELRQKYPDYRISVTIQRYSMGQSLHVDIYETGTEGRTDPARRKIENEISKITDQYNFDDSDTLTDYFHVNFYAHIRVRS